MLQVIQPWTWRHAHRSVFCKAKNCCSILQNSLLSSQISYKIEIISHLTLFKISAQISSISSNEIHVFWSYFLMCTGCIRKSCAPSPPITKVVLGMPSVNVHVYITMDVCLVSAWMFWHISFIFSIVPSLGRCLANMSIPASAIWAHKKV
jgi:hypothetical protein